jgi:hypothetical protein
MQKKFLQTFLMAAILSPTVAMAQLQPPGPKPQCGLMYHAVMTRAPSSMAGSGDPQYGWICVRNKTKHVH